MIIDRPRYNGLFDFITKPIENIGAQLVGGLNTATERLEAQETQRVQAFQTAEAEKQLAFQANLKRYAIIGGAALGGLFILGLFLKRRD